MPVLTIGNASIFPRHLVGSLAILTCGALVAVARSNNAQQAPAPATRMTNATVTAAPKSTRRPVQLAQATGNANTSAVEPAQATDDGRRPVEFYTQTVRGGLFSAPEPPAPKAPVVEAPKVVKIKEIPVPVEVVNPFDEWTYSGLIVSGTEKIAVIENRTTKEGRFLKLGDTAQDARLEDIDRDMLTFRDGKKPYYLAKSQNINVTPLDRSAVPVSSQQQAQPAPQGQQPQQVQVQIMGGSGFNPQDASGFGGRGRGMFGGGAGGSFTLPNGMQLDPTQFQRRSMRMNRGFNQ